MRAARTAAAIVDRDLVEYEAAVRDHPEAGPAAQIAPVARGGTAVTGPDHSVITSWCRPGLRPRETRYAGLLRPAEYPKTVLMELLIRLLEHADEPDSGSHPQPAETAPSSQVQLQHLGFAVEASTQANDLRVRSSSVGGLRLRSAMYFGNYQLAEQFQGGESLGEAVPGFAANRRGDGLVDRHSSVPQTSLHRAFGRPDQGPSPVGGVGRGHHGAEFTQPGHGQGDKALREASASGDLCDGASWMAKYIARDQPDARRYLVLQPGWRYCLFAELHQFAAEEEELGGIHIENDTSFLILSADLGFAPIGGDGDRGISARKGA